MNTTAFPPAAPASFLIHSPTFYLCSDLFITDKSRRHVSDSVEFLGSNFIDMMGGVIRVTFLHQTLTYHRESVFLPLLNHFFLTESNNWAMGLEICPRPNTRRNKTKQRWGWEEEEETTLGDKSTHIHKKKIKNPCTPFQLET